MLQQTRDLRQFPMTPEQYRQFSKLAQKQKILFSAIRDKDGKGKLVDVVLPVTELDRANLLFERIGLVNRQQEELKERVAKEVMPSKKESPLGRDSPEISSRSASFKEDQTSTRTNERPSVEGRLKAYREQLTQREPATPVRNRTKAHDR